MNQLKKEIQQYSKKNLNEIINIRSQLQAYPELDFEEFEFKFDFDFSTITSSCL